MEHTTAQLAAENGSKLQDIAWMVLASPLLAAAGTLLFTRRNRMLTALFNISAVVLSFILSVTLLGAFGGHAASATPFHWLPIPGLELEIGLHIDGLANLMLVVVTGVASLVMIYSTGYMQEDPNYPRFFRTLSLFVFSMLGIVLADNLVMMFVFWELVGVSSYLLIGFWHDRPSAGDAAKKAFLVNRLGDFGFLLGILLIWSHTGTVNIAKLAEILHAQPGTLGAFASLAGFLVFMGAMGKSAQFPLHVWLPDAMEGPTPVSALIHAATMVAAGVYLLCRVVFLFALPGAWPGPLAFLGGLTSGTLIAWIGGFTALLAALTAVQQDDIKRILAYSTLSQLGYMVMAVGLGASTGNPSAAMYHLVTHAFFKAMLFLGAGAVIHACHHEQDIWKMGGLAKKMPVTFWTFAIGTLALAGVPPFSGFYSKDDLLVTALTVNPVLFGLAVIVAALTTFYMGRLVLVAFLGQPRSEAAGHAHEVPANMRWPLLVLAVPSVAIAWFPLGDFLSGQFGATVHGAHAVAEPAEPGLGVLLNSLLSGIDGLLFGPFNHNPAAAMAGVGAVILGGSLAWSLYATTARDPLPGIIGRWARACRNKFYFDEIYGFVFVPLHDAVAALTDVLDRWVVRGLVVRGVHGSAELAGRTLRLFQSGNLQTYSFLFVAGAAVLAWLVLK